MKTKTTQPQTIPLPPGCSEEQLMGQEDIVDMDIGDAFTGTIEDMKSVQTTTMKKANRLITFHDEQEGRVKFWSCGHLNTFLDGHQDIQDYRITIQRIEDFQFKKGLGKQYRVFVHGPLAK